MKIIEIKKFGVVTGFEVYKHNQKICDFDKNMQGFIQNFKLSKDGIKSFYMGENSKTKSVQLLKRLLADGYLIKA